MNCKDFRLLNFQIEVDVNITASGSGYTIETAGTQIYKPATLRGDFSERVLHCSDVNSLPAGQIMYQRLSHCGLGAFAVESNSYANVGQINITLNDGPYPTVYPAYATFNNGGTVPSPDAPYYQASPFLTMGLNYTGMPPFGSQRALDCYKARMLCFTNPENCFSYVWIKNAFDPETLPAVVAKFDLFKIGANDAIEFYTNPSGGSGTFRVTITSEQLAPSP